MEAAALQVEDLERAAEQQFDAVFARAEAANDPDGAKDTPEFRAWMAARAETDAAWGRWADAMEADARHG